MISIIAALVAIQYYSKRLSFSESETSSPTVASDSNQREQKLAGIHLVESREGFRDWELYAAKALGSQGKSEWQLESVQVLFYSGSKIQFTVVGDKGKIDSKSRDLTVDGNVVVQTVNGYELRSNRVVYLAGPRRIIGPQPVEITAPKDEQGSGFVLNGTAFNASVEASIMNILGPVSGRKSFNDSRNFVIRSEKAELSSVNKSIKFSEQMQMTFSDFTIQGPEARFEYGDGKEALKNIWINGGARMQDPDKIASANQIQYVPSKQEFILTGKPRVVQGADEYIGDKITLSESGSKLNVEKFKARLENENQ